MTLDGQIVDDVRGSLEGALVGTRLAIGVVGPDRWVMADPRDMPKGCAVVATARVEVAEVEGRWNRSIVFETAALTDRMRQVMSEAALPVDAAAEEDAGAMLDFFTRSRVPAVDGPAPR